MTCILVKLTFFYISLNIFTKLLYLTSNSQSKKKSNEKKREITQLEGKKITQAREKKQKKNREAMYKAA